MNLRLLSYLILSVVAATEVEVELDTGRILGKSVKSEGKVVNVFKNVPFAEPPINDLRFRPPQPKSPWNGTRDGREYSPACVSDSRFPSQPQKNIDEDCLYLNIFAGEYCLKRSCAVMFYIHGGGFLYNSATMFNDTAIIRNFASQGAIFVIPAYRVGFFGFFEPSQPSETASYNVGVLGKHFSVPQHFSLDIIHALSWVHDNIHKFGGDPDRVTISGNSAGGGMALYVALSPKTDPNHYSKLFISSGSAEIEVNRSLPACHRMSRFLGCRNETDPEAEIVCLRSKTWRELATASRATEQSEGDYGPTVDGIVVFKDAWEKADAYFKGIIPIEVGKYLVLKSQFSAWPEVDAEGQNYYYLNFATHNNGTREKPHAVNSCHFDEAGVHFWLDDLREVEDRARNSTSYETPLINLITSVVVQNDTIEDDSVNSTTTSTTTQVVITSTEAVAPYNETPLWSRYVTFLTMSILTIVAVGVVGLSRMVNFYLRRVGGENAEKNEAELKRILKYNGSYRNYGVIDEYEAL